MSKKINVSGETYKLFVVAGCFQSMNLYVYICRGHNNDLKNVILCKRAFINRSFCGSYRNNETPPEGSQKKENTVPRKTEWIHRKLWVWFS